MLAEDSRSATPLKGGAGSPGGRGQDGKRPFQGAAPVPRAQRDGPLKGRRFYAKGANHEGQG
jgi:hypothetical protein